MIAPAPPASGVLPAWTLWVPIVRDIVATAAAVVTAIVAARGVSAWRHQMVGKAEFDAARDLSRAVHKLVKAVQISRTPVIAMSEYPPDPIGATPNNPFRREERLSHVFKLRRAPVLEAEGVVADCLADLEIPVGPGVFTLAKPLDDVTRELALAVSEFVMLDLANTDLSDAVVPVEERSRVRGVVFELGAGDFNDRLVAAARALRDGVNELLKGRR
jgi:hypothetical protein